MIDWITCQIPFRHPPIASGAVLFLDSDDSLEKAVVRRRAVSGSHSQTITVRSTGASDDGMADHLSISGNPAKFLQGHNLFGVDDLVGLTAATVQKIADTLDLQIDPFTWRNIEQGNYDVSTVDINYSFWLPTQADVQTWIREAEFKSRSRAGRPATRPGTIYWQKHSRRWALKAYSKWQEIHSTKDHRLPESLSEEDRVMLSTWAENILRLEVRLKSLELRDLELTKARDLNQSINALFHEYAGRIIMTRNMHLSDQDLFNLPTRLRATYTLWHTGHNVCQLLSKPTFYRHRKELLKYGIDISVARECPDKESNVVPLVRILEAKPVGIPQWAYERELVFNPAAEKVAANQ